MHGIGRARANRTSPPFSFYTGCALTKARRLMIDLKTFDTLAYDVFFVSSTRRAYVGRRVEWERLCDVFVLVGISAAFSRPRSGRNSLCASLSHGARFRRD